MSDQLVREFVSSFQTYVNEDGDRRHAKLKVLLQQPAARVMLMEPMDVAALLTRVVNVDPKDQYARQLVDAYEDWMDQRADAEDEGTNPDSVAFNCDMSEAPFTMNNNMPNAEFRSAVVRFIHDAAREVNGPAFLIQIFVCLMKANEIPQIKPYLQRPSR